MLMTKPDASAAQKWDVPWSCLISTLIVTRSAAWRGEKPDAGSPSRIVRSAFQDTIFSYQATYPLAAFGQKKALLELRHFGHKRWIANDRPLTKCKLAPMRLIVRKRMLSQTALNSIP